MEDTDQQVVNTSTQGTNEKSLFCKHCGSQFLSADKAKKVEHERSQTHFQEVADSNDQKDGVKDTISSVFWEIGDVWDFDNIGQTRAVTSSTFEGVTPETVYVVCADCERGPVGIRWAPNEPYYVAHSQVIYERPEGAPEDGAIPPGMTEDFFRGLIAQQQLQQQASRPATVPATEQKE